MFERYTDRARRVVSLATEEARDLGSDVVDAGHLILGLIHEGDGIAAQIMKSHGLTLEGVRNELYPGLVVTGPVKAGHIPMTTATKRCFEQALRQALQLGHSFIGTEHLLLGTLKERCNAEFFSQHGIEHTAVRQKVIELVGTDPPTVVESPAPLGPGHVRNLLLKELASLDSQIDSHTRELDRLNTARADVKAHLGEPS